MDPTQKAGGAHRETLATLKGGPLPLVLRVVFFAWDAEHCYESGWGLIYSRMLPLSMVRLRAKKHALRSP